MKWGCIQDVASGDKLLYWVLIFLLQPYFDSAIDHWLKDICKDGGGMSGDPGWSIDHMVTGSQACFRVWADPEMSGIEPSEATYSDEDMRRAIRDTLNALAGEYPRKSREVELMVERYCA
ncbi:hypothetical protein AAHK20_06525 [Trinickia sp. YCB016]